MTKLPGPTQTVLYAPPWRGKKPCDYTIHRQNLPPHGTTATASDHGTSQSGHPGQLRDGIFRCFQRLRGRAGERWARRRSSPLSSARRNLHHLGARTKQVHAQSSAGR